MRKSLIVAVLAAAAVALAAAPAAAAPNKSPTAQVQKAGKYDVGKCRTIVRDMKIRGGQQAKKQAVKRCKKGGPGAI